MPASRLGSIRAGSRMLRRIGMPSHRLGEKRSHAQDTGHIAVLALAAMTSVKSAAVLAERDYRRFSALTLVCLASASVYLGFESIPTAAEVQP